MSGYRHGGGDGFDQADYFGASTDFNFVLNVDGTVKVSDMVGDEGEDILDSIEALYFNGDETWMTIEDALLRSFGEARPGASSAGASMPSTQFGALAQVVEEPRTFGVTDGGEPEAVDGAVARSVSAQPRQASEQSSTSEQQLRAKGLLDGGFMTPDRFMTSVSETRDGLLSVTEGGAASAIGEAQASINDVLIPGAISDFFEGDDFLWSADDAISVPRAFGEQVGRSGEVAGMVLPDWEGGLFDEFMLAEGRDVPDIGELFETSGPGDLQPHRLPAGSIQPDPVHDWAM